MTSFKDIYGPEYEGKSEDDIGMFDIIGRRLRLKDNLNVVSDWLCLHEFDDLVKVGKGGRSIVLRPKGREDYVIRITLESRDTLPHIIQPFFTKGFGEYGWVKAEFLLNIEGDLRKKISLLPAFIKEISLCNYLVDHKQYSKIREEDARRADYFDDFGIFRYRREGRQEEVLMGMDGEMFSFRDDKTPLCSYHYPTLEDQWKRQCETAESDPRLLKMIGGLPQPLPETRFILSPGNPGRIL